MEYWREYRTYFHIGQSWAVHEATVCRIVKKVENALLRCRIFQLPGKKQLLAPESVANLVVIDATETPIERPKKGLSSILQRQEETPCTQITIVVDPKTKVIICTTFAALKEHDFHLFKRSRVKLTQRDASVWQIGATKGYRSFMP